MYIKVVYGGKEGYIAAEAPPVITPVVPTKPEVASTVPMTPTTTTVEAQDTENQPSLDSLLSRLNKTPEERATLGKCLNFTGFPSGRKGTPITLLNFVATQAENITDIQINTPPDNATVILK